MPEWGYMLIVIGMLVSGWYILLKMREREQKQKDLKAEREHELKMLKAGKDQNIEKMRLEHNLETHITKDARKREKAQMTHELQMSGKSTTSDKAIEAIPETFKNIRDIVKALKK